MSSRIYLDWNATTPPLPDVIEAMREAAQKTWGNPASIHADGRAARAVVESAREAVAELTGVDARDVTFTANATEANNLALRSVMPGTKILTSRLEHPSITRTAELLEREVGARIAWIKVLPSGVIDLADLETQLEANALVTIQAVTHETGIIQPASDVIAKAKAKGARVHLDAAQGWGKVHVASGWDSACVAPHKMRGPKGIGALVTQPGVKIAPVLAGGSQEKGIRPGTVDPVLCAGFGAAAKRALLTVERWWEIAKLRDELELGLLALGKSKVAGDPRRRAPHVSNMMWKGWIGAELVAALDLEGVSVSSGAACSAGTVEPSPVLSAMFGDAGGLATSGVRCSLGDTTTLDDVRFAIEAFRKVVTRASA
jgi:cysteine desulfurase